jgi:hypothetical protein
MHRYLVIARANRGKYHVEGFNAQAVARRRADYLRSTDRFADVAVLDSDAEVR